MKSLIISLSLLSFLSLTATPYREDLSLIDAHTDVFELISVDEQSRLCVSPQFQGRALIATLEGLNGESVGWMNRKAWESGSLKNGAASGGIDRLWIGPLGSQYSFYYQQIKPLSSEHWLVPAPMNSEPYEVVYADSSAIRMKKMMQLTNFIGTEFNLEVDRMICLLDPATVNGAFGVLVEDRSYVAFESRNTLINRGDEAWTEELGIPTLWSLGMYQGTDEGVLFIPLREGVSRDAVVEYLSEADRERIRVENGILIYKCDGKFRNKIGVPPEFCGRIWGSYHPEKELLTLVRYHFDPDATRYFNSTDSVQEEPYRGEPIQVYNHGPMDLSEGQDNLFYEMESTSASVPLESGASTTHWHQILMMKCEQEDFEQYLRSLQF